MSIAILVTGVTLGASGVWLGTRMILLLLFYLSPHIYESTGLYRTVTQVESTSQAGKTLSHGFITVMMR